MGRLLRIHAATFLAAFAVGSCSTDPGGGDTREPGDLTFLELPANHPPFFNTSASFFAKINRSDQAKLYFQDATGGRGEAFAELRIDTGTLLARPDGTPYGPNDSVLITMRVVDPNQVQVELSPGGIKFSTSRPAELRLEYDETGGDLDGDGDHDAADDEIEQRLSIWRQENLGDPYVKVGTIKTEGLRELKAFLTTFSRLAIAY